jgi:hypothetical protein
MSRRKALQLLAGACGGASILCSRAFAASAAPATLYFYSSETNINNFGTLKGEFDSFFATAGGHRFQPFSDRAAFEGLIRENRPGLYLMSSWDYAQIPQRPVWNPVLVGTIKDKATQRHVLCAKKFGASLASLSGITVASAGKRAFTQGLLTQLLPVDQQPLVPSLKVLEVPKDMDALMAVGFGAAAAAVTTENGLEKLKATNSKQHDQLSQLAVGSERLLPLIVTPSESDAACQSLIRVLASMGAATEGRQRMRLLGLDGWKPIDEAQIRELRK